jgi:hypothetical protein
MKTKFILLFMSIVLIGFSCFGQSGIWTKEDRNNIYDDCMSYIGKYKNLNTDQRESISLCYLNEITKQYTKQEYQNKIDIEIKKIRESTLSLCSKNLGIDLSEQKKEEPIVVQPKEDNTELEVTKENLKGHWKDENSEFWLFETGDYKMQYGDGKEAKGTWKVDNNQLTLYKEKLLTTSEKTYKILIFTKDKFVYQSIKSKEDTFTATRIK